MLFIGKWSLCPSVYYFYIALKLKNNNAQLLHSPESEFINLVNNEKAAFYAHGDPHSLCFYYWLDLGHKKTIPNKSWDTISVGSKLAYFHACYGSKIISQNSGLSQKFPNWVSYTDKVLAIRSEKHKIDLDKIIGHLINETQVAISKSRNSTELFERVRDLHKTIKDEIHVHEHIKSSLIMMVGQNMRFLVKSPVD